MFKSYRIKGADQSTNVEISAFVVSLLNSIMTLVPLSKTLQLEESELFESQLVGNPGDRFSHYRTQIGQAAADHANIVMLEALLLFIFSI